MVTATQTQEDDLLILDDTSSNDFELNLDDTFSDTDTLSTMDSNDIITFDTVEDTVEEKNDNTVSNDFEFSLDDSDSELWSGLIDMTSRNTEGSTAEETFTDMSSSVEENTTTFDMWDTEEMTPSFGWTTSWIGDESSMDDILDEAIFKLEQRQQIVSSEKQGDEDRLAELELERNNLSQTIEQCNLELKNIKSNIVKLHKMKTSENTSENNS